MHTYYATGETSKNHCHKYVLVDIDLTPRDASFSFKPLQRLMINNRIKNLMKQMQRVKLVINNYRLI